MLKTAGEYPQGLLSRRHRHVISHVVALLLALTALDL